MDNVVWSSLHNRFPVVLSPEEIVAIFKNLPENYLLMAKLIYGGGLRLSECLNRRVKDLVFSRWIITVRTGNGNKDRQTLLPEKVGDSLSKHLVDVRSLYEQDRKEGVDGVELPHALERKYPFAGTEVGLVLGFSFSSFVYITI